MQTPRKFPIAIEQNLLTIAIAALIFLMYAPLIIYWYDGWLNKSISIEHEYFSHGIIGLPFAGYIAWNNRQKWENLPDISHPLGGVLLGIAGVWYISGIPDLINLSFPIILAGICLWFKGIPGLKLMGMPLLFILLASPNYIPYLIEPYALPIQKFIATVAGFILTQLNMEVIVEQIYLYVGDRIVEVAPHCAGLKMLFTSLYVSLMLLYWTGAIASRAKTIFLLVSTVLISVSANIVRNTVLTIFHGTGQDEAFHWLHDGWGGDMYSACTLILLFPIMNWIDDYFTNSVDSPNESDT
ncbi:MAG: cyanoexosortase B [Okeania sp. SIO3I5]|uniref:cyanoexosortase B n=1 Tax=Okeania sp. SIO3I5 TaxID=2607805 RepID=UPI0013BA2E56|nr:cyanoexosortase B [Okeania sp. SIO3I5]NEQ34950.1 cyanoexosortase B [Okeania sp. SIO3I5]